MPFKTRITDLLGIEHPIVQGGMQGVDRPDHIGGGGDHPEQACHNAGCLERNRVEVSGVR